MTLAKKLNLALSPDDISALEQIAKDSPKSESEHLREQLVQWEALHWSNSTDRPLEIILPNGLSIINNAGRQLEISVRDSQYESMLTLRDEVETLQIELEEMRLKYSKEPNTFAKRFWNALVLKPGFMGFSIDLKILFNLD